MKKQTNVSTFYLDDNNIQQVYTTNADDSRHKYLRDIMGGNTYIHNYDDILCFMDKLPADSPVWSMERIA